MRQPPHAKHHRHTRARQIRHTCALPPPPHARQLRHTRAREDHHTRARRGYLAAHSTEPRDCPHHTCAPPPPYPRERRPSYPRERRPPHPRERKSSHPRERRPSYPRSPRVSRRAQHGAPRLPPPHLSPTTATPRKTVPPHPRKRRPSYPRERRPSYPRERKSSYPRSPRVSRRAQHGAPRLPPPHLHRTSVIPAQAGMTEV